MMCKTTQEKQPATISRPQESFFDNMRNVFLPSSDDSGKEICNLQPCDILCGRGSLMRQHGGNTRFRLLIEMNRERYQTALAREMKTNITMEILELIRSCDGRFVKINGDGGEVEEISDESVIREKISHALRSAKDPNRQRIRKPRKSVVRTYSDEAEQIYAEVLEDQQAIFQRLQTMMAN